MEQCDTVRSLRASVPVAEYVARCVDVEKFLVYCRECDNYARRWSCPPFSFAPLELWHRYQSVELFARILMVSPGAELPDMMEDTRREKARLMEELLCLEKARPGSLALSAGGCSLCGDSCSRPDGAPCRNPAQMRYSIDALGGDISKTMELYFQTPILWVKDGKLPEYLTLVGGLLLGEAAP